MVRYRVTHRTNYRYESVVSSSYGEAHLLPRASQQQDCLSTRLVIDPEPNEVREHVDYFGNRTTFFALSRPHVALTVTCTSDVEVHHRASPLLLLLADQPWESVRDRLASDPAEEIIDARQYLLESPLIGRADHLATRGAASFTPNRPCLDAVADLASGIYRDFVYRPGATTVTTTLDEFVAQRAGVCQDFAHLAIGCLRAVGLAARYVSGYLETDPPPGSPRLQGADESHAWASVFVPDAGWIDIDPTNDQFVNERYVVTAWGRDYSDVPPLKGVIFTKGATRELEVKVDVVRL